jgi:hypothetical protein
VTPEGKSEGTQRESGERDDTGRHLSREVAGYRRRLRETEAERDRFAARLDDAGEGGFATGRSASCGSSAPGVERVEHGVLVVSVDRLAHVLRVAEAMGADAPSSG